MGRTNVVLADELVEECQKLTGIDTDTHSLCHEDRSARHRECIYPPFPIFSLPAPRWDREAKEKPHGRRGEGGSRQLYYHYLHVRLLVRRRNARVPPDTSIQEDFPEPFSIQNHV